MRGKIEEILTRILGEKAEVAVSPRVELGHYSTNVAMRLAKDAGKPFGGAQGKQAFVLRTADRDVHQADGCDEYQRRNLEAR